MTSLVRYALAAAAALGALTIANGTADVAWAGGAARCRVAITSVRFGLYNPFAAAATRSDGTVVYSCTSATPVTIGFNRGGSRSFLVRQMSRGAARLAYNLYLDPAATEIWGDGTGGSHVYRTIARPNAEVSVPVFGRIAPLQRQAPVGFYSDRIVVTISF